MHEVSDSTQLTPLSPSERSCREIWGKGFHFQPCHFFTEPNPRAENRLCYLLKTKFGHVRRKWKGVNMLVCLLLLEQWIGGGGVANTGSRHVYGLGA